METDLVKIEQLSRQMEDENCRPRECRSYPHLHNKDFVFRMNQAYDNCPVCPIVFNVYEGLKRELWKKGKRFAG